MLLTRPFHLSFDRHTISRMSAEKWLIALKEPSNLPDRLYDLMEWYSIVKDFGYFLLKQRKDAIKILDILNSTLQFEIC